VGQANTARQAQNLIMPAHPSVMEAVAGRMIAAARRFGGQGLDSTLTAGSSLIAKCLERQRRKPIEIFSQSAQMSQGLDRNHNDISTCAARSKFIHKNQ
jgi:hypothetical protein